MDEILEIKNVGKKYQHKNGETIAIKDINFKVRSGEFISIIGPSGCRKINIIIDNHWLRRKDRGRNLHRKRKSRWIILKNRIYATKRLLIRMENNI